jgi:hypothetical protein
MWIRGTGEPDTCRCGAVHLEKPFSEARRKELGQRARKLEEHHGVDLPAAYSIAMGILTVEQVGDVPRPQEPTPSGETAAAPDEPGRKAKFDRCFDQAVADGCLTAQQAFERGNREALVTRIAARHRLQKRLAYAVADNRMPLLAALREQSNPTQPVVVPMFESPAPTNVWLKRGLAVTAIALAGVGAWAWMAIHGTGEPARDDLRLVAPGWSEPAVGGEVASRAKVRRASTRVDYDELGRVTRVEGPDPRSVAIAFCESVGGERAFEVFDVVPSVPPESHKRLGLIRDLEKRSFHMITIMKDHKTRRWTAGNGRGPVRPGVAPQAALNAALTR